MGFSVYTVSVSGKQYFGITAAFETRPALDLADAARDEPLTWIGAQLKTCVPEATRADFLEIETHDTLCAAIASQVQRIARCRKAMDDTWYDEVPPGYFPEDGVETDKIEEFVCRRGPPILLPWMSDEAAVELENDIMWSDRDAAAVFFSETQCEVLIPRKVRYRGHEGDVAELLARFYKETLIRRRTVVSSSAAYETRMRKVVFKTGGTYPDDWDSATPAEFAETAATWICDRAEQFALRVLSGHRCANARIDMNAMRILARDALRIMHEDVGKGQTALDVARARVSRTATGIRGDLVHSIRIFMTDDMNETMRVYNIRRIMPRDHPECVPRKAAPVANLPWPPVVVPESFLNLAKSKRELSAAA